MPEGTFPVRDTRGIMRPAEGRRAFRLTRLPPAHDLADLVELHWMVAWELPPGVSFTQEVLPHPSVNVVAEAGAVGVFGIPAGMFARTLTGGGRAVGVKFRPGAFRTLLDRPAVSLRGVALPGTVLFGDAADGVASRVGDLAAGPGGQRAAVEMLEDELRRLRPTGRTARRHADRLGAVRAVFDRVLTPGLPELRRVDALADEVGTSVRGLQRIFTGYVGVTPKWVLMRHRVHLAAERIAQDPGAELARVAADLAYVDQAHFTTDFTRAIGCPPAAYAARCRDASEGRADAASRSWVDRDFAAPGSAASGTVGAVTGPVTTPRRTPPP